MKRETGRRALRSLLRGTASWQAGRHTRGEPTTPTHRATQGRTISVSMERLRNASCDGPPTPTAFHSSSLTPSTNTLVSASVFVRNSAQWRSSAALASSLRTTNALRRERRDPIEQRAQLAGIGRVGHGERHVLGDRPALCVSVAGRHGLNKLRVSNPF